MPLNLTLVNDPSLSSPYGCWCWENTAFEVGMVGMESQLKPLERQLSNV